MNDISPISRTSVPAAPVSDRAARPAPASEAPSRGADSVELSANAKLLSKLAQLPEVRQDLIDRVRAAIADESYDSAEKIDAAIDRMVEEGDLA